MGWDHVPERAFMSADDILAKIFTVENLPFFQYCSAGYLSNPRLLLEIKPEVSLQENSPEEIVQAVNLILCEGVELTTDTEDGVIRFHVCYSYPDIDRGD